MSQNKNKIFYKQRPYIYVFIAAFSIIFAIATKSKLAFLSGLILITCTYVVLELRSAYQKKQSSILQKSAQNKNKI